MKRSGPLKRKTWMRRRSKRLVDAQGEYRRLWAEFMARPENEWCPVADKLFGRRLRAKQVHHMNSRYGKKLNDTSFWLAVSRRGHAWIHENANEARENGWLV